MEAEKPSYEDKWHRRLYNELPPPLPLLRNPLTQPKETNCSVPESIFPVNFPSVFKEELTHQFSKEEVTDKPQVKQKGKTKRKSYFLDLFNNPPKGCETVRSKCECSVGSKAFQDFRNAVGDQSAPIPIIYKDHSDQIFKQRKSLCRFQFLYISQRPSDFKVYLNKLLDPGLPIYNKGELIKKGICETHLSSYKKRKKVRQAALEVSEFTFDSDFECGNLDKVLKAKENEFNLFLTPDTNTRGHTQWFYFSVTNKTKRATVTFNIMNFTKNGSLFNRGMRPVVYSVTQYNKHMQAWHRGGFDIRYKKNNLARGKASHYFTLSYSYTFNYENDTVYFAYSEPYTYTRLVNLLHQLRLKTLETNVEFSESSLCQTLGGLNCPMIRIRSKGKSGPKTKVCISARVHPGETVGSFMCEGLLNFLTSNAPEAELARKKCDFFIIPMLNPDGVVCGNYRSSLAGVDLNRRWKNPDENLYPTIYYCKQVTRSVFAYIDLHGHSKKEYCFMYGNSFQRKDPRYWQSRVVPFLLSKLTSHFNFSMSRFFSQELHPSTGRAVVFKDFSVVHSFTLEASFHGYKNSEMYVEYTHREMQEVGRNLGVAILGVASILLKFVYSPESLYSQVDMFKNKIEHMRRMHKSRNFGTRNRSISPGKVIRRNTNLGTSNDLVKLYTKEELQQPEDSPEITSFKEAINIQENAPESGSDSDPSEDDLEPQELLEIQKVIKKSYIESKALKTPKSNISPIRPTRVQELIENYLVPKTSGLFASYKKVPKTSSSFRQKSNSVDPTKKTQRVPILPRNVNIPIPSGRPYVLKY